MADQCWVNGWPMLWQWLINVGLQNHTWGPVVWFKIHHPWDTATPSTHIINHKFLILNKLMFKWHITHSIWRTQILLHLGYWQISVLTQSYQRADTALVKLTCHDTLVCLKSDAPHTRIHWYTWVWCIHLIQIWQSHSSNSDIFNSPLNPTEGHSCSSFYKWICTWTMTALQRVTTDHPGLDLKSATCTSLPGILLSGGAGPMSVTCTQGIDVRLFFFPPQLTCPKQTC